MSTPETEEILKPPMAEEEYGGNKRLRVCTRCLRSGKVIKAA